ncbi:MAG: autotransporter outer membrane beta-barrel domain-containing protein [Planctomycetes bacterium]|nr:autotransporter outer membrane beta-barrel domain-containing protein [Planctomycetota bacterium]
MRTYSSSRGPAVTAALLALQLVLVPARPAAASNFAATTRTRNQTTIATIFDRASNNAPAGDLLVVLNELATLTDTDRDRAFDRIAPEELGTVATSSVATAEIFTRNVLAHLRCGLGLNGRPALAYAEGSQDRLLTLPAPPPPQQTGGGRTGGAPGEGAGAVAGGADAGPAPKLSVWVSGFGQFEDFDDRPEAEGGAKASTEGLTGGVDYRVTDDALIGLTVGGAFTDINGGGAAGNADYDTWSIGLYGGHTFGPAFVQALLAYSHHDIDTDRPVRFGTIFRSTEGNHGADEFDGHTEVGYDFDFEGARLQPSVGLAFVNLDEESFTETGADVLNLDIDAKNTQSLRSGLGLRLAIPLDYETAHIIPELLLRWEHEFLGDDRTTSGSFPGIADSGFRVQGIHVESDAAVLGFGIAAELSRTIHIAATYEGRFGEVEVSHLGRGDVEVRW